MIEGKFAILIDSDISIGDSLISLNVEYFYSNFTKRSEVNNMGNIPKILY